MHDLSTILSENPISRESHSFTLQWSNANAWLGCMRGASLWLVYIYVYTRPLRIWMWIFIRPSSYQNLQSQEIWHRIMTGLNQWWRPAHLLFVNGLYFPVDGMMVYWFNASFYCSRCNIHASACKSSPPWEGREPWLDSETNNKFSVPETLSVLAASLPQGIDNGYTTRPTRSDY